MNKTAIKNFAIWARNKLIADITYKAGLLGITDKEIKNPLPQSTQTVQFFNIGTKEPYSITGIEIDQRRKLVEEIKSKAEQSDYTTAYRNIVEEVAYTWFNRLIAIRFMEVNEYLPTGIRVLSSESSNKLEPDLVTNPLHADLDYTQDEKERIMQLKHDNKLDELFRMLFIKQCNALNVILPELFEKTSDYTELLLNVSFTDQDGVVYHLVKDIEEDDFKEAVEIIGWMYQYYNSELKDETFALLKKNVKITKERIPSATQLFTPDWIVRYMVENSLGRLWLEGHPNDNLKSEWKYYLDEAEQEPEVQAQLDAIREEYKTIKPEDIKIIDPCMGSGHILVYAFDVLMQIYESYGYSQRDAAMSIVENNLYGLDIDNRAYQLAYFAIMMKARQYNRRILDRKITCNVYAIQESNGINREQLKYFGAGMGEIEKNAAMLQIQGLLDTFIDAKEYGSILNVDNYDWRLLEKFADSLDMDGQMMLDSIGIEETKNKLSLLIRIGAVMAQKYDVVVTNPPYMGISNSSGKLNDFVKKYYPESKADIFAVFIERCQQLAGKNRYCAMITQHSWMFLSSFESVRLKVLECDIINMAHLGAHAFEEIGGEIVQTTTFITRYSKVNNYKSVYVKLTDFDNQKDKESSFLLRKNLFVTCNSNYGLIPTSPIAYWISKNIYDIFRTFDLVGRFGETKKGVLTGNDAKYVRLWFEIEMNKTGFGIQNYQEMILLNSKWIPATGGGTFRKWYGNFENVINMENDAYDIRYCNKNNFRLRESKYYFQECTTWSEVSGKGLSMRFVPNGILFGNSGPVCFWNNDIYYWLALLNSKPTMTFLGFLSPTLTFGPEQIKRIPCKIKYKDKIENISKKNVELAKMDWDDYETSWEFSRHPIICNCTHIKEAFTKWEFECKSRFDLLKTNEETLNKMFIDIYGLQDELSPEVADKDVTIRKADRGRDIRSFISYAIGCMFGRYSLDVDGLAYAGGEWDNSKYSTFIPDKDNILPITDEEYFEDDIVGLFCAFLKKTFGAETLEENLDFIAKALGNKGNTSREIIRNYILKDFFKDHCKIYQKRPIYWLFDSGKADGFKALVYMHRYNEDTIGNLRIDYLHRIQRVYESEIARMQETIDNSGNAREVSAATKRKEKLIKQLKETKEYDEKIAHLAVARIAIDLDDGVKVNYEKVQTDADGNKLQVLAKI